ncbi:FadR/GntR family transcriptional regulator [Paenibacillus oceani]|uniref:FadR family transcriptional regulator n=1 Tax=Paenibacillus oceani TaxID=2772510 RepID=A0A927CFN6_9BACL|nr:FadR/GntR family transcriptional regulator [Paenibacillus oceani]MBD2866082.1 FadR family transcriptional regulator [Paenibacillus oceani]
MKPIQKDERFTLSQIISEKLKQYIIEQQLTPGQKLPSERELVKTLEVSRSVLREALRALENSGILSIRHGEGAFIQRHNIAPVFNQLMFLWKLDHKKVCELFELRQVFELSAIEQAVDNATESDFDRLETLALRMKQVAGDTRRIQETDIAFHQTLISATHNELFTQLTELIVQYFASIPHHHMGEKELGKSVEEHLQIVDALRSRNPIEAKRILRSHLQFSKKYVKDVNDPI